MGSAAERLTQVWSTTHGQQAAQRSRAAESTLAAARVVGSLCDLRVRALVFPAVVRVSLAPRSPPPICYATVVGTSDQ